MRVRHRGFTLIELMIVVGIIGLLASVAIPQFQRFQLRSKTAERALLMSAIERAVDDYYARESRYPTILSATTSQLNTSWNPSLPAVPFKRPMPLTSADWNKLNLRIDGNVYYSYYATAYAAPGTRYMYDYGVGDLDGDREYMRTGYCYIYHYRQWSGSMMVSDTTTDTARDVASTRGCF
jgi:type IV pilus assembly protein PilA